MSANEVSGILVPRGSLEERTLLYVDKSGYDVYEPRPNGLCGSSRDGEIEFILRDRRMIAPLVACGDFDAGVTGIDLLLNSGYKDDVRIIANLCYAKKTDRPTRWVLAEKENSDYFRRMTVGKRRIGCELERLPGLIIPSGRFGIPLGYEVVKLEGDEEWAIDDGYCDMILVVTETGKALEEAGLHIVPGCEKLFESHPVLIAKPELSPEREHALRRVAWALGTAIGAATRRMMKFDLPRQALAALQLPAEVAPTVSDLVGREEWVAVEICIPRWEVDSIGLQVEEAGAHAIVLQEVIGFSPGKAAKTSPSEGKSVGVPHPDNLPDSH